MTVPIRVSTPVGKPLVVDRVYRSCLISLVGYDTWVDLIILGMLDFDVILGMDWLSPYHVVLDCNAKTVTLAMPVILRVEWKSASGSYPSKVISFIRAQKLVERGCLSYLAFIRDSSIEPPPMDSIPVVQEFLDVFPSDLPRKANVVADALSRKTPRTGSLAALSIEEKPLARDVQILANSLVRLQISEKSDGMIAFIEARSSLVEQIRAHQFDDEKLCLIRDKYRLLTAQSRQKSYADQRVRDLVFMEGDHVWLRVSPMKGVMSLSAVHPVFHALMLRKYIPDESHVISLDSVELGPDLTYEEEPIAILDRQIRKFRTKELVSVKVQWKHRSVREATWETESDMRARYPQLFEASDNYFYSMFEVEHDF
ncbi:uncharacterized protein [Solanum lycopersicum]|uniref:uncharacterized protein n=1 Tax=Solanum lycopersicum TaxID=4081 RepID=UPI0037489A83